MRNHVIIGGSDAGISAALRIKEIDPAANVSMFLKDRYPNYSICGIPFFLSGEIKDWQTLAHRKQKEIESLGIEIKTEQEVLDVDTNEKVLSTATGEYNYDKLLIATGANSLIPAIHGLDLPGVFTLRWIDEMLAINKYLQDKHVRSAVIIGGGYIGVEMADAFHLRGLKVTLFESSHCVLKTLDQELGKKVEEALSDNGVNIIHNTRANQIVANANNLSVITEKGFSVQTDLVIVATGARPNADLLLKDGIATGPFGAYKVNQQMESSHRDIYIAGDCAETWHTLLKDYTYLPLGTTAHKQGRVAGENMAGGNAFFQGSVGTQVVKVFNLIAGRTGLHDKDCLRYSIPSKTVESDHWDHKVYYPGAEKLSIRITANPVTKELLGFQIVGSNRAEVSKRIDIAAIALQNNYKVEQLMDLDLAYTPPFKQPLGSGSDGCYGMVETELTIIDNVRLMTSDQYDIIIIGGGQSGLACGYFLHRINLKYLILDDQPACGGAWTHVWDSLTLFSPAEYSSLPGRMMPKSNNTYPLKQEVINYLCSYEASYKLNIKRPERVISVTRVETGFELETDNRIYHSKTIISATGCWQRPFIPRIEGLQEFKGEQLHSAFYTNPAAFIGKKVLVVGGGNSGAQVLAEVSKVTQASWATLKDPTYLPDEVDGRVLFDVATVRYNALKAGKEFNASDYSLGNIVMVPAVKEARDRGVLKSNGHFNKLTERGIVWDNGPEESFDVIIWCTGFMYATQYLNDLVKLDEKGKATTKETQCVDKPGLWFVGYGNWTGFASATLIGVGRSARETIKQIQEYLQSSQ